MSGPLPGSPVPKPFGLASRVARSGKDAKTNYEKPTHDRRAILLPKCQGCPGEGRACRGEAPSEAESNPVKPSQTQSNQVQPPPSPMPAISPFQQCNSLPKLRPT